MTNSLKEAPSLYQGPPKLIHRAREVEKQVEELYNTECFKKGEHYFTSLRIRQGVVELWDLHRERLKLSFLKLGASLAQVESLLRRLEKEISMILCDGPIAVRIECYKLDDNHFDFLIVLRDLNPMCFSYRPRLSLKKVSRPVYPGGELKIWSYEQIEVDLKTAQKLGYDEVLYYGESDELFEVGTSNICLLSEEDVLIAPKIGNGVLKGLYQEQMLKIALEMGLKVERRHVLKEEALNAKALLLTNCLRGLRLASCLENRYYDERKIGPLPFKLEELVHEKEKSFA